MRLPDLLVIGAGKSGTTSLHDYLGQHPDVFMSPVKETNFFASEGRRAMRYGPWPVTTLEAYGAVFAAAGDRRIAGEASPLYLYTPDAPARVHALIPDVRLVAVLRDPAERAWSSYLFHRARGTEARSFEEVVRDEARGDVRETWPFAYPCVAGGLYHRHLTPWLARFGRERIAIHLYDDLRADPVGVTASIFAFVGVDDGFVPDTSVRHNAGGVARSRLVRIALKPRRASAAVKGRLPGTLADRVTAASVALHRRNLAPAPPLDPEMRARLIEGYRPDVLRLQEVIGRDLTGWLTV